MITIEEAKKMVGTEFIYMFKNNDEIPAYVKKFDPEVGLTCISLDTETKNGYDDWSKIEDDGTVCVIGVNIKEGIGTLARALEYLDEIKQTGRTVGRSTIGMPFCAF